MRETIEATARQSPLDELWRYPLMAALLHRRARRFALGMELPGGPLAYQSRHAPLPLSLGEEAVLALAAAGVTGFCLAELPYESGQRPGEGGGNIMASLVGRTVASADAIHGTALIVLNDEGSYLIRRPQDDPAIDVAWLARMARDRSIEEVYEHMRVRLRGERARIPREVPHVLPFNKWSANADGSTYFLPVSDLTALYINLLLAAFDEDVGLYVLDERRALRPAGVGPFARLKGKHLHDDPDEDRVVTVLLLESILLDCLMAEQAAMLHNLSLLEQAMGLGGWTHFAGWDLSWYQALGFRMAEQPVSKGIGAGRLLTLAMGLLGKNRTVPVPLGLERDGEVLLKPFCPPYYNSMEDAVLAFVERKFSPAPGMLKGATGPWKEAEKVRSGIPRCSDNSIAATIAYCRYLHETYGRFPGHFGPWRTTLAHQAHHLDLEFYERFYEPEACTETHRRHMEVWHGGVEGS